MAVIEKLRPWWRPAAWLKDAPTASELTAWLVSAALHLTVLLALASITLLVPIQQRMLLTTFPLTEFDEDLQPIQDVHFSADAHEHVGALGAADMEAARPSAPVEAAESEIATSSIQPPRSARSKCRSSTAPCSRGRTFPRTSSSRAPAASAPAGAMGAVDRITHEILLSLDERPTLVVWLFDQSGSLKPQRESIAKRFDRVYDELGIIEKSGNEAFKHDEKTAADGDRRNSARPSNC